ncbi:CoA transferase [Pseudonocardia sp. NPDC049154]|uniref:CaiB/BaiF CoA transferase family protein n=1 Tax=Pseudonocardia sp. NPDC049154 TaxID=3155501 RepID=UPI0033F58169
MTEATNEMAPLDDYTVVDLSTGVAGAYCTRLLAGAGAVVVLVEPPEGDPLRHRSASGVESPPGVDGALFRFLSCAKQSVVADPERPTDVDLVLGLLASADAVVWSPGSRWGGRPELQPAALHARFPSLDVLALTPFGLDGPWADRAATEFTLQAWAGAIGWRGLPGRPPVAVGGRVGEWAAGTFAAAGLLASRRRQRTTPGGQILDTSILDAVALSLTNMHPVTYFAEAGRARDERPVSLLPGIHPTADGWIGFMTVTGQQWLDFCALVERIDWMDDESLGSAVERERRRDELTAHIDAWAAARTTAEILELAATLRVPAAPVGTGATVPTIDHFVDQEMFVENPRGGFVQPATPYRLRGKVDLPPLGPPPALGEHTAEWVRRAAQGRRAPLEPGHSGAERLPFDDLRVVELTAFWAGPSAAQFLGMHGAEVIKVESPARPDGMRTLSTRSPAEEQWWEYAPLFHATNTNKLGLGLRLDRPRGPDLLVDLLDRSDVLVENFSPRVLEAWGLDHEVLRQTNPGLIVVRMPAFGLAGPWRDRTGFAQTMEQASGMAWVTGFPDGPPQVPSGVCDPLAGAHAAFALQVALAVRDRTGEGMLVEVPMVASALNVAAAQVVEYAAHGVLVHRTGNHSPCAAPQNLYRTRDPEDGLGGPRVAISVETDAHWSALVGALGGPQWALGPELATFAGRKAREEDLDTRLAAWCAEHTVTEIVELLWTAGVPVGRVAMPHEPESDQFASREFFERVEHPWEGTTLVAGSPVRFSRDRYRMHRRRAPMLGEHNRYVVTELLGMTADEYAGLEAEQVIGKGLCPDGQS